MSKVSCMFQKVKHRNCKRRSRHETKKEEKNGRN